MVDCAAVSMGCGRRFPCRVRRVRHGSVVVVETPCSFCLEEPLREAWLCDVLGEDGYDYLWWLMGLVENVRWHEEPPSYSVRPGEVTLDYCPDRQPRGGDYVYVDAALGLVVDPKGAKRRKFGEGDAGVSGPGQGDDMSQRQRRKTDTGVYPSQGMMAVPCAPLNLSQRDGVENTGPG